MNFLSLLLLLLLLRPILLILLLPLPVQLLLYYCEKKGTNQSDHHQIHPIMENEKERREEGRKGREQE